MSDQEHDEHGAADDLEELGDDIIIAQETAAHAPAARAQVATVEASVVISEPPGTQRKPSTLPPLPPLPPLRRPDRSEKTVVIRDRRAVQKLLREASRRPRAGGKKKTRTLYLVGVAILASLAAGTLLATLTNPSASGDAPGERASAEALGPTAAPSVAPEPERVDLEDLPVVKKKRKSHPK